MTHLFLWNNVSPVKYLKDVLLHTVLLDDREERKSFILIILIGVIMCFQSNYIMK